MVRQVNTASVTFTVIPDLLTEFDETWKGAYYNSRSAALAEAMRDLIQKVRKRKRVR